MRGPLIYALKITLLAVAYFATGKLSLLLAIPPGFATPVWPAAGIALAATLLWGYRVLPGVFIGSFITNIFISLNAGATFDTLIPYYTATGIALGATLQAGLSCYLILRVCIIPTPFNNARDITHILLRGGAIGCGTNALVGSGTLLLAGIIPENTFWLSVFTWWVGDFIGVALFAPMLLILANKHVSKIRKVIIFVPIMLFVIMAILIFISEKKRHQQKLQVDFNGHAQRISSTLDSQLSIYLNILTANERFINASKEVTAPEFNVFTQRFIVENPGIQSLSWNKKVARNEREAFEKSIVAQGFPGFVIKDRISIGNIIPAAERDRYFPITYIVPFSNNASAHGFDVYGPDDISNDIRRKVLNQARDQATPTATGRISIVQAEGQYGLVFYKPVYKNAASNNTTIKRRESIKGYVAGVFIIPHMLTPIRNLAQQLGTDLVVMDVKSDNKNILLFDSRTPDFKESQSEIAIPSNALTTETTINVAGRQWQLNFIQKPDDIVISQGWELWYVLVGGLLLSVGFGVFLLIVSGNTENIQNDLKDKLNDNQLNNNRVLRSSLLGPILTSLFLMMITFVLWQQFKIVDKNKIKEKIKDELTLITHTISSEINSTVFSLNRMAERWRFQNGTPKDQWTHDAIQYVNDFPALTTVEWVDKDFIIRWAEPISGNEKAIGLNIAFDEIREKSLIKAEDKSTLTLTPPIDIIQGYRAFIGYAPIYINNQFDGFIVGIYDSAKFITSILSPEFKKNFNIRVVNKNINFFPSNENTTIDSEWELTQDIDLFNQRWSVSIWPNTGYIEKNNSFLSVISLLAGLLFSLLAGFTVYTLRIAKQRSALLQDKTLILENREKELRVIGTKLELILNSAGEGIYGIDTSGGTSFINQAALDMLGYSREELLNKNAHNIIHHHYANGNPYLESHCKIRLSTQSGKAYSVDNEVFWKKCGDSFPVEYLSSPITDNNGNISGAVVVFRDISERQAQQAAVHKVTQALNRTNHMAGIGGWEIDLKTNEVNWTEQMYRIHDVLNIPPTLSIEDMLQYYSVDSKCILKTAMDHAIKGGDGWDVELPLTTATGRNIWIRMVGAGEYTDKGITTLVGTLQDISEKKYYTDELKRSNKDLSDFAYVASHDLKAPLRGVDQLTTWIEEDLEDRIDPQTKEYLTSIKIRINRMKRLLDDLLEYSRAGQKGGNLKFTDSEQLIKDVFELSNNTHSFKLTLIGEFPTFLTEAVPLEKVFRNLIGNAIKHHDAESGVITIESSTLDQYYQFTVKDDGPGIPLEYTELAFGMFQTLKPRDEVEGSGMGLALVKKTIALLGGSITLSANEPRGACFTFTWPKVID